MPRKYRSRFSKRIFVVIPKILAGQVAERLHHEGGDGIMDRKQVEIGRVDDDKIGEFTWGQRADLIIASEHAGVFGGDQRKASRAGIMVVAGMVP